MRPTHALDLPRQVPAKRPARERIRDFDEIDVGLSPQQAMVEALRCVQCSTPPCAELGCPLGNQIPRWIDHVAGGRFREAARILSHTTAVPEMCGRLCPHESLCESRCVAGRVSRPVSIGRLEELVARLAAERGWLEPAPASRSGKRVAVVGSGPAGLAAADRLLDLGHAVVIFERRPVAGGVPIYGIPTFKYAKARVETAVARVRAKGAEIHCGISVGRDVTVDALFDNEGFDAVLLATGAPRGRDLEVPGRDLANIYGATPFLINGNLRPEQLLPEDRCEIAVGKTCAVIGGGDTGADCVRTAVRLGFEKVVCIYRRSEEEIPGRAADRGCAVEEGVEYLFLATPVRFDGDDKVERMTCARTQLGEPDESGRRRPEMIEGSEFTLGVDAVVLALGYRLDEALLAEAGIDWDGGGVKVDADLATSRPGVFAAGDVVNGADLIVTAARDGRDAAMAIDRFLEDRVTGQPSPVT